MLRAVQCCESAIVFKRNAVDTMTETLDALEKKLRAALARVEAARESQSGVNMGELTQMMIKALKARKKASKRNADFIVRQIASEAGDAPLPEPVDFDADADNYDPSDAPDEYHPPDESNKRPRR
jgi:regulator of Ty1 transposition protein 103